MEIINLGAADGLPAVSWATVAEKLDSGSAASCRCPQRSHHVALDGERRRQPARDRSRRALARRKLLVPDRMRAPGRAATSSATTCCSIAVSVHDADVVVEGEAMRETDPPCLARLAGPLGEPGMARRTRPERVRDHRPHSTRPPGATPWNVYRIRHNR